MQQVIGLAPQGWAAAQPLTRRPFHLGGEAMRDDPRFATPASRRENMDALELLIAAWIERHDLADVLRMGREADVVIGPIMDAGDLMADAQVQALRLKYVPTVSQVLPGRKAATFFQLDRRLNMIIDLQLFSQIPLAHAKEQLPQ